MGCIPVLEAPVVLAKATTCHIGIRSMPCQGREWVLAVAHYLINSQHLVQTPILNPLCFWGLFWCSRALSSRGADRLESRLGRKGAATYHTATIASHRAPEIHHVTKCSDLCVHRRTWLLKLRLHVRTYNCHCHRTYQDMALLHHGHIRVSPSLLMDPCNVR